MLEAVFLTEIDQRAAVPVGPQILSWVEAETAQRAECSGHPALDLRSVRLSAVLDDHQIVLLGKTQDGGKIGGQAVKMHWQDGADALAETLVEASGVEREGVRGDIGDHRACASGQHC